MGYCGDCKHLTSRHNCQKYKKGLTYSRYSSRSIETGTVHERCSECDKDFYIAELESHEKQLRELVAKMEDVSDRICLDEEPDGTEDGEENFNQGRGKGIFEMCVAVKAILDLYN